MRLRRFVGVLASFLFLSIGSLRISAQTQTTGALAGVVTDPSGAVIPGAAVTLQDLAKGTTQSTTATAAGEYRFELLPPGPYAVTAKATGFQVLSQKATVVLGEVTTVNFQMILGAQAESVTVTAEAVPLLQAETGNVSSTISEVQAANIPNPGNDLTYMAQIAPGSVMNTAGGGLGNFSSFGISAVANLFTVNGMDYNDPFLNVNNSGATNLTLGQNEVQEVSVVTNGYSGQYGGLAGANVNYITRSGSNNFHGRATWYWNGRYLNANSWFNNATATPRSFVNANQYGGDIGGPIIKNKLFFYFNAEGLYLVIPTSAQAVVPSTAFATAVQNNINTTFGATSTIAKFYQTIFTLYSQAPGISRAANTLPDGDCDSSFLGFVAPKTVTPFGAANPCGLAFFSNISNKTHEHLEAGRIDWNATSRDRFFGRVWHDRGLQASITDTINPLFNIQSDQPQWQGQFQETHTFSGTAVNQLIVSAGWYQAIFGNGNQTATLAAFPTTIIFASGQFSDMGGLDFYFPQGRRVTQGQISDDFTKMFGEHTLKVGLKYRRNWVTNLDYGAYATGIIEPITEASFYSGGTDGNTAGLQSFPTSLEQPFAVYTIGGYVEDDWKVDPSLTLTLALRLDHPSIAVCFHNCFALAVTQFPQLSADPSTPYDQLIKVNQHQMLPDLTTVEPQPRFGFAWQPHVWGMRNTVVRGGAGLFYDSFPGALLDNFSENPPLDPQFLVFSGSTVLLSAPSDPAGILASAAASNKAFQTGFKTGGSFNTISAAVPGFSPPALALVENHPKVMQYQKWSLEVERQFGTNTSFALQYVGNHAVHIYTQNSGINGCNNTGTFAALPPCNATSGAGVNPNFLNVNYAVSGGVANYNGLTASFTHRYKSGLVQVNYSWGHALDTVSNSGIPSDAFGNTSFLATNNSMVYPEVPANPRFNYGNADYDVRHSLNANYVWELPIKRFITRGHGPGRLLEGWDVGGSMFLRSGFPLTLVDAATSTALQAGGYGSSSYFVNVFGTQLAPGGTGVNCKATFAGTPQPNRNSCLNPANFSTSPQGFGNVRRNTIRGPYYWDTDFSLMKHTKIWERSEFVFGAQFFNIFNHPNFDAPVMDTSSLRFGQIIKTVSPPTTMYGSVLGADASPRIIQLKMQLNF